MFLPVPEELYGYCWPLLIGAFTRLASEMIEGVPENVGGEGKEGAEDGFF